jgi:hypothetical protein
MSIGPNTHIKIKLKLHNIDSSKLTTKELPTGTIQSLTNIINVKHLLYSFANVM